MAVQLDFSSAEQQRLKLTQDQQAYIANLYRQASKEIGELAKKAPRVPSDALRKQYLKDLQGQIDERLKTIEKEMNRAIRSNMTSAAKATVADAKAFLKESGLPIKGAYSYVPKNVVQAVASGQLYAGNWTLSKALWLNTAETQQDVQSVVAQGIIQNKSAYDIAKDLEKYVDPDARKDWEWSKVYPGTKKMVDYNAQRLARTMVSHAYQQAFVQTTKKNPFVKQYKWESSGGERMCEICEERNGQLYDKDDLPLDHPNGMCTFIAVMDDLDTVADRLADWAHGKPDAGIDAWAEDLYGKGWEQKKSQVKTEQVTVRNRAWVDKNFASLKKNIETTYGKDTWDALAKDILSKPETTQDWINRWTHSVKFGQDGDKGYFRGSMIYENMVSDAKGNRNRLPFSTFYHELGHYIDTLGKGVHTEMSAYGTAAQEFYGLLQKEYSLLLTPSGTLYPDIRSELRADNNTSGVQDIISGLSLNSNRVKWGHNTEYWTRKDPSERWKEVTSETFANMNEAYCMPGSTVEASFQTYFPESYAYFIKNWVEQPDKFYKKG